MIKITKQILLLIIILLLIGMIYFVSNYFLDSDLRKESKKISEKELYITNKFRNLVDETKLKEGFWYTTKDKYGNETVAFFDPAALSGGDLTNEEIDAIYNQAKTAILSSKNSFKLVPEEELPLDMQFHNSILTSPFSSDPNKYLSMKDKLIASSTSGKASKDDLIQLSFIYELEGKYSDRDIINRTLCKSFGIRCSNDISIEILGKVKDARGWAVQNATVSVFGNSAVKPVLSNDNGDYKISLKASELQKIRLKITKNGFSDAVVNTTILNADKKIYRADEAVITSANGIFTIDTVKKTITGSDNKIDGDYAIINTTQSTYAIPLNVFFDKNGKPFKGQVEAVVYEFNRSTTPVSIMAVDTFDDVRGYAGNLLETFGMPYIQFFDSQGNKLFVKESMPIKLTYKMYHMADLYSGSIKIFEPVTEKEVDEMIQFCKSSKEKYPITRQFLIDNDLAKFPAWWIFDQNKGVWDNVGYRLVDNKGLIETIFYTIKDMI